MTARGEQPESIRVLTVYDSLTRGGAEAYAMRIARAASEAGWDAHAAFPETPDTAPLIAECNGHGISFHPARFGRAFTFLGRRPRPLLWLVSFLEMQRVLRIVQPELVHFVLAGQKASMPARIACALAGIPAVNVLQLTPRNWDDTGLFRTQIEGWLTRRHQQWVAVSEYTARFIREKLRIPDNLVNVIHNSVDVRYFSEGDRDAARAALREELKLPKESRIVLTVARLGVQKGHGLLLPVLPQLLADFPDLYSVWIGDGECREEYLRIVKENKLEDRVFMPGFRTDVKRWYQGSDLFAFPTHYEGFAHAVLEAAAAGLPVIASSEPGILEAFTDESALLVEENTAEAWDAALRQALTRPETMRRRAETARNAVEKYDVEVMKKRTLELLKQAAGKTRDLLS